MVQCTEFGVQLAGLKLVRQGLRLLPCFACTLFNSKQSRPDWKSLGNHSHKWWQVGCSLRLLSSGIKVKTALWALGFEPQHIACLCSQLLVLAALWTQAYLRQSGTSPIPKPSPHKGWSVSWCCKSKTCFLFLGALTFSLRLFKSPQQKPFAHFKFNAAA